MALMAQDTPRLCGVAIFPTTTGNPSSWTSSNGYALMGASFWISMSHPGPTPPHAMCGSPPLMPPHGYTHPLQLTPESHQQGPLPLPRLTFGLQFPSLAHFKALASIIFHSLASYYVLQISFQFFGPIRVSVAQWTKALIPLKAFFSPP